MGRWRSGEQWINVASTFHTRISKFLKNALDGWQLSKIEQSEEGGHINVRAVFTISIPKTGAVWALGGVELADFLGDVIENAMDVTDDEKLLDAALAAEKPAEEDEDDELEAFGPTKHES